MGATEKGRLSPAFFLAYSSASPFRPEYFLVTICF